MPIDENMGALLDLQDRHPEIAAKKLFVDSGNGHVGAIYSTDAAKILLGKGAHQEVQMLLSILDAMGEVFKARIIRENILPQYSQ